MHICVQPFEAAGDSTMELAISLKAKVNNVVCMRKRLVYVHF